MLIVTILVMHTHKSGSHSPWISLTSGTSCDNAATNVSSEGSQSPPLETFGKSDWLLVTPARSSAPLEGLRCETLTTGTVVPVPLTEG